jgi:dolichyl-phosphate-mannose--protein O-mannosyl transferase
LEKLYFYLNDVCVGAGVTLEVVQCGRMFFYVSLVALSLFILALSVDTLINMIRIGRTILRILFCFTILVVWIFAWSHILAFVKQLQ